MPFELRILLASVVLPAGIAVAFALVVTRRSAHFSRRIVAAVLGGGWWLGLVAAQVAIVPWQWWSDEPWQRLIWPLLLICLLMSPLTEPSADRSYRVLVIASLSFLAAWVVMPRSPSWQDMWSEHSGWMMACGLSGLWNTWSIEALHRRDAGSWCLLVLLAGLGSVLVLAAGVYATMAQWMMAAIAATTAMAFFSGRRSLDGSGAVIPMVAVTLAMMTAWTRFRGSAKPVWVYALILFTPTMIAGIDWVFCRRLPSWGRVLCAASLAAGSLATVLAEFFVMAPEESW